MLPTETFELTESADADIRRPCRTDPPDLGSQPLGFSPSRDRNRGLTAGSIASNQMQIVIEVEADSENQDFIIANVYRLVDVLLVETTDEMTTQERK
jgi:hypothetical protein